jgi:CelD/BcsL family acetyltransferase involved in cellulose biosynthesis
VKTQVVTKQSIGLEVVRNIPKSNVARFTPALEIIQISTQENLRAIETDWRKLESQNQITPTVFQSYDWASNWCKAYHTEITAGELTILIGRQNGAVVFLFPLMVTKLHGLKALQWLTEPIGQYGDVLCAKGQDVQKWMTLSFEYLRSLNKFDLVRLRHVRADSLAAPFVQSHMVDAKYYERAPYLDLTNFKTDQDYDARYTSTQRKRRKKIRKSLEDLGEVKFAQLSSLASKIAIDKSIEEKNAWLSERGRYNRIMGCPRHINFLKSLADCNSDNLEMVTSQLSTGTQPISWEIAFRYQGTHFAYITSHVNKLTDLSPGRLHMDLSQRAALASGLKRFDLMVPYDQHKESWSSAMVDTNDYFTSFSTSGHIYGNLYLRTLRPIIRKLYYKTPPWALRFLQLCFFCKKP